MDQVSFLSALLDKTIHNLTMRRLNTRLGCGQSSSPLTDGQKRHVTTESLHQRAVAQGMANLGRSQLTYATCVRDSWIGGPWAIFHPGILIYSLINSWTSSWSFCCCWDTWCTITVPCNDVAWEQKKVDSPTSHLRQGPLSFIRFLIQYRIPLTIRSVLYLEELLFFLFGQNGRD